MTIHKQRVAPEETVGCLFKKVGSENGRIHALKHCQMFPNISEYIFKLLLEVIECLLEVLMRHGQSV